MTKATLKGAIITVIYYIILYFIVVFAVEKYPSNGAPSEAVFIMLGFALLSLIIFLYCLVKLIKGDTTKWILVIIHLIAVLVLYRLFNN